jgi:hypothetical protein
MLNGSGSVETGWPSLIFRLSYSNVAGIAGCAWIVLRKHNRHFHRAKDSGSLKNPISSTENNDADSGRLINRMAQSIGEIEQEAGRSIPVDWSRMGPVRKEDVFCSNEKQDCAL